MSIGSNLSAAAAVANGEVLCFVNAPLWPQGPDWLDEIVARALQPENAFVGAKLRTRDAQQGPMIAGPAGHTRPSYRGAETTDIGYHNRLALACNVSVLAPECFAVRRRVFQAVAAPETLAWPMPLLAYALCLKARHHGLRNVWTPFATLNKPATTLRTRVLSTWQGIVNTRVRRRFATWTRDEDPFFNPNLSVAHAPGRPAFPPRREKPWHRHLGSGRPEA